MYYHFLEVEFDYTNLDVYRCGCKDFALLSAYNYEANQKKKK